MSRDVLYERVLASLHDAAFDDAHCGPAHPR